MKSRTPRSNISFTENTCQGTTHPCLQPWVNKAKSAADKRSQLTIICAESIDASSMTVWRR
jgi:hypothetical protein